MWELDCGESWALKNWCFWSVVLEKTLESPLDCKEIQPVHSEGDQAWAFFGGNHAEAQTPVPPHAKSWLIGKDSDAGRDWGQEGKGMTEDEMAGWHHWLDGRDFEWTPGDGDGQGGLACCDSWGRKETHWATELNWRSFLSDANIFYTHLTPLNIYMKVKFLFLKKCINPTQEGSALKTKSPFKGPTSNTITLEIRSQLMSFGRHRPSVHCRIYLLKLENLKQ